MAGCTVLRRSRSRHRMTLRAHLPSQGVKRRFLYRCALIATAATTCCCCCRRGGSVNRAWRSVAHDLESQLKSFISVSEPANELK